MAYPTLLLCFREKWPCCCMPLCSGHFPSTVSGWGRLWLAWCSRWVRRDIRTFLTMKCVLQQPCMLIFFFTSFPGVSSPLLCSLQYLGGCPLSSAFELGVALTCLTSTAWWWFGCPSNERLVTPGSDGRFHIQLMWDVLQRHEVVCSEMYQLLSDMGNRCHNLGLNGGLQRKLTWVWLKLLPNTTG